jgi:hypothetical protein
VSPIFNLEIIFLAEVYDLQQVFFWQNRAGAVYNLSSLGLQKVQTFLEDYFLYLRHFLYSFQSKLPSQVRVPAHDSGPCAGDVKHDPVALLMKDLFELLLVVVHLAVLNSCPSQALLSLQKDTLSNVMYKYLALVVHERCEAESFTSRATTVV